MSIEDCGGDKAEECGPVHHWLDPKQIKCRCGKLTTVPFFAQTRPPHEPARDQVVTVPARPIWLADFCSAASFAAGLVEAAHPAIAERLIAGVKAAIDSIAVAPHEPEAAPPRQYRIVKYELGGDPLRDWTWALLRLDENGEWWEGVADIYREADAEMILTALASSSPKPATTPDLRALIAKWRHIAHQHGESETGAAGVFGEYSHRACADELEQALAASPGSSVAHTADNRAWIDKEPKVAALMALAARASGYLERSEPNLAKQMWAAIQVLTLPALPPARP